MIPGVVAVAIALLAGVAGAAQAAGTNDTKQAPPAPKAQAPAASGKTEPAAPVVQSRRDKVSYAFGADLARDLKRQSVEINTDLVVRALTDSLAGRKLIMTDEEVAATLNQFAAEQKEDYQHARMMVADKNKKASETFVAENVKKEGIVTLPSGLQYKVLKRGNGRTPSLEDYVVCNYKGALLDGTEIDGSYKRKEPTILPVKGVIPGLMQALQLMPVGSKWQVFIPPPLAYGEKIVGGVGPNAMLIFEVELLSIKDKTQIAQESQSAEKKQSAGGQQSAGGVQGGVSKSQAFSPR
jgi:FKBP-type peptidyl-prolyl cis-trans isomerase FklB